MRENWVEIFELLLIVLLIAISNYIIQFCLNFSFDNSL